MADMLTFLIGQLGQLVNWLSARSIVSGVSLLGFFAALITVHVVLNNFLFRAR